MKQPTNNTAHGFTIVELLIVIVVIGILAAITVVAYSGIQSRANNSVAKSDLRSSATAIEMEYVKTGAYPVSIPSYIHVSPGTILQLAATATDSSFCLNAYSSKDSQVRMSWSSSGGLQNGLCSGIPIGDSVGGSVPVVPRNVNLMPDFPRWTLAGGSTYNPTTKELTLPSSGTAVSPIIRVDFPARITVGSDFYANVASGYGDFAPRASYHTNIIYFGSDGVTRVANSAAYTSNGCARPFPTGAWANGDKQCGYLGGPNVLYAAVTFTGANGGYASTDLKLRTPLLLISD